MVSMTVGAVNFHYRCVSGCVEILTLGDALIVVFMLSIRASFDILLFAV